MYFVPQASTSALGSFREDIQTTNLFLNTANNR